MSLAFAARELYGGAIVAQLPIDVVDASNLRQVPDHQEVFLSDKTLTSIIFEINQYQTESSIVSQTGSESATSTGDEAAASYHLNDVIEAPDHLSASGIQTVPVKLAQASVGRFPAYQSTATIISPEIDRHAKSSLSVTWQTNPPRTECQIGTLQLLVRMQAYATDLCVRINIPLRELGDGQSEAAQAEVAGAEATLKMIIESLDIKDFGLFGAE